jgi:hypothetical protein
LLETTHKRRKVKMMRATVDELKRTLPGDDLIPIPGKAITHAITINAPSEMVWPWLVQLGSYRAGWYSYDRIDNGGRPSARKIIPDLQHIEPGSIMPAVPGSLDAFIVREVHPGKALVLVVPIMTVLEDQDIQRRMKSPLRVSWTLALETIEDGGIRLISRGRISPDWLINSASGTVSSKRPIFIERVYKLLAKIPWSLMVPMAMTGHYIMESHMLHGIKWRAEAMTGKRHT